MKLGIIGTEQSMQDIYRMIGPKEIDIEFIQHPCSLEKVPELLETVQKEVDGILFTGKHFFSYASIHTSAIIPWGYPKRATRSVLRALLKPLMEGLELNKITFDLDDVTIRQMMLLLCDEAGQNERSISLYRYNDTQRYIEHIYAPAEKYHADVTDYHLENLRSGRATCCLSGAPHVVENIKSYGYPAFLIQTTEEDIAMVLNELRFRYQRALYQAKEEYRLVVLSVTTQMADAYRHGSWEYRHLHSYHQIETNIYAFAQSIGAAVEKQSPTNYLVYSTKAEIDMVTEGFTDMGFIRKLQSIAYVERVTLGIGIASTHGIAKKSAQYCSEIAEKQKTSCYYLMEEKMVPSGPFVVGQDSSIAEVQELQLEQISAQTGVGIVVLNRLAKVQAQYGSKSITPGRLAKICDMTVSNMNRVIVKLETAGYAKIVGSYHHNGSGRPSRLICLNLGMDSI